MTLQADLAQIQNDASLYHQIVHGNASTTVTTEGGIVPSMAKAVAAMGLGQVKGEWTATTVYALSDVVTNGGFSYRCILAHTSSSEFATDLPTKWVINGAISAAMQPVTNAATLAAARAAMGPWGDVLATATGSSTARSLQDRFADTINVKDFGAVGDGITDDTSAIQLALNAAATLSATKPVTLLIPGLHYVTPTHAYSGLEILMCRPTAQAYPITILGGGTIFTPVTDEVRQNYIVLEFKDCTDGVDVRDLHIIGSRTDLYNIPLPKNNTLLYFSNCGRVNVSGCTFKNAYASGIFINSADQVSVSGCQFFDCLDALAGSSIRDALVTGCQFKCVGRCDDQIAFFSCSSVNVSGNLVDKGYGDTTTRGHARCCTFSSTGGVLHVSGNVFRNNNSDTISDYNIIFALAAISIEASHRSVIIANNTMSKCRNGVTFASSNSVECIVSDNVFDRIAENIIFSNAASHTNNETLYFTGNKIIGCGTYSGTSSDTVNAVANEALHLDNAWSNIYVTDNFFSGTTYYCEIVTYGTSSIPTSIIEVSGNRMQNAASCSTSDNSAFISPIYVSDFQFSNNVIRKTAQFSIYAQLVSGRCEVSRNRMYGALIHAAYITVDNGTFSPLVYGDGNFVSYSGGTTLGRNSLPCLLAADPGSSPNDSGVSSLYVMKSGLTANRVVGSGPTTKRVETSVPFQIGDIWLYESPTSGGYVGEVKTALGWKTFGAIS